MIVHFNWHTATEDLTLGRGHVETLPPVGALIGYVPPDPLGQRHVCWRVTEVMITPAVDGSPAVLRNEQLGVYHVFVEPAEGPFHP